MSIQDEIQTEQATVEEKYNAVTAIVIQRLSIAMFLLTAGMLIAEQQMTIAPDAVLWARVYLVVSIVLFLLHRFVGLTAAAFCLVASLWLAATVAIGRYSGVGGMLFTCYSVLTFLAAVVMRSRRWLIVLAICLLSGAALYFAEIQGILMPRGYGVAAAWFPLVFQVSLLLIIASLIMWSRRQVLMALGALTAKNEQLVRNRGLLEQRSAESEATTARLQLESQQRRQGMEKLRKAESALRASEKRYRTVFEHDPNAIIIADMLSQKIIDVNGSTARLFGYSRDELLTMSMQQLSPQAQPDWVNTNADTDAADRASFHALSIYEWVYTKSDSQNFPAEVRMVRLPTLNNRQLFQLSVVDITERHYALRALRESEARYRTLVENAPDAILVLDVDNHCVVEANENAAMLFGKSLVDILASDIDAVVPLNSAETIYNSFEAIAASLEDGQKTRIEFLQAAGDDSGERYALEAHIVRLPSRTRRLLRASIIDVSRRRAAEQMLDAMPGCVAVVSHEGDLMWVNPLFVEKFGLVDERVSGQTIRQYISLWDFNEIVYELEDEDGLRSFKLTAQTVDGKPLSMTTRASLVKYRRRPAILLSFDATIKLAGNTKREGRQSEEFHLSQQQGRDMQHLIGQLLNQTTIALSKLPHATEARRHIEKSLLSVRKMSDIASATFGEPLAAQIAVRNLDINALIESNEEMFRLIIGQHVILEYDLETQLPLIHADSDLIKRALTGLILNAVDSIGAETGLVLVKSRVITISADMQSEWIAQTGRLLKPGAYVSIVVDDNGFGHSPLAMRRLFDPSQGGSGARMAAIVRVVRGHRGGIRAVSREGEGSTFELIFPVAGDIIISPDSTSLEPVSAGD